MCAWRVALFAFRYAPHPITSFGTLYFRQTCWRCWLRFFGLQAVAKYVWSARSLDRFNTSSAMTLQDSSPQGSSVPALAFCVERLSCLPPTQATLRPSLATPATCRERSTRTVETSATVSRRPLALFSSRIGRWGMMDASIRPQHYRAITGPLNIRQRFGHSSSSGQRLLMSQLSALSAGPRPRHTRA